MVQDASHLQTVGQLQVVDEHVYDMNRPMQPVALLNKAGGFWKPEIVSKDKKVLAIVSQSLYNQTVTYADFYRDNPDTKNITFRAAPAAVPIGTYMPSYDFSGFDFVHIESWPTAAATTTWAASTSIPTGYVKVGSNTWYKNQSGVTGTTSPDTTVTMQNLFYGGASDGVSTYSYEGPSTLPCMITKPIIDRATTFVLTANFGAFGSGFYNYPFQIMPSWLSMVEYRIYSNNGIPDTYNLKSILGGIIPPRNGFVYGTVFTIDNRYQLTGDKTYPYFSAAPIFPG